jgi:hypothetical protein
MPKINKALAILAALGFFLPFVTISCNGVSMMELSGAKLAQCAVTTCSPDDLLSPSMKALARGNISKMNVPAPQRSGKGSEIDGANFVLLAAIACLLAIAGLFFAGRAGELLSGAASAASIVLLFMFRSKFGDAVTPHLQSQQMDAAADLVKFQLEFSGGFWWSVMMSLASAILAFKGTVTTPGSVSTSITGATSGGWLTVCSSCGAGNPSGNKFCSSCGKPVVSSPVRVS